MICFMAALLQVYVPASLPTDEELALVHCPAFLYLNLHEAIGMPCGRVASGARASQLAY
jgi:hypothetical protein